MGHNEESDNSDRYIQPNSEMDIKKLLGSIKITNDDDLVTQIIKWYVKTDFITFLKAIERDVCGQSELCLIVYEVYHYLETIAKGQTVNKQRTILVGPSGCGKTETIRSLKKYFRKQIPKLVVCIVDTSLITLEGFEGNNTKSIVQGLKRAHSSGIGIIFLDEFDKKLLPSHSSSGENVNRQIQNQLLLTIEGCEIDGVDTSKTLIIGMGSFNEIRERRQRKKCFGFGVESEEMTLRHYDAITKTDMIELGASFELIGRFGSVVNYGPLSHSAINMIIDKRLNEISNSLGIKVSVNESMRDVLHNKANSELGNRVIEAILRDSAKRAMVEILTNEINAEEIVVIGPEKYIIKENNAKSCTLNKKMELINKIGVEKEFDKDSSNFEHIRPNELLDSEIDQVIAHLESEIAALEAEEKKKAKSMKVEVLLTCEKESSTIEKISRIISKHSEIKLGTAKAVLKADSIIRIGFKNRTDAFIFIKAINDSGVLATAWIDAK